MAENWILNGNHVPSDPKILFGCAASAIPELPLWSYDALRRLYAGLTEMSMEMAKIERSNGRKASMTRFIKQAETKLRNIPKEKDALLRKIYNRILETEGHPLLRGFGMGNMFGGSEQGNPEFVSMKRTKYDPTDAKQEAQRKIDEQQEKGVLQMAEKIKRSALSSTAQELNEVLGLSPAINVTATVEELTEKILEAAEMIDPATDKLTPTTTKTIAALVGTPEPVQAPPLKRGAAPVAAPAVAVSGVQELANIVAGIGKLKELKELVAKQDVFASLRAKIEEFQGLQGPRLLKPLMLELLGVVPEVSATKTKSAAGPKKELSEFGHRADALSGQIDAALRTSKPCTAEQIAKDLGCDQTRVKNHITHLIKDKGMSIVSNEGVYTIQ
jgi:hypothetical protein